MIRAFLSTIRARISLLGANKGSAVLPEASPEVASAGGVKMTQPSVQQNSSVSHTEMREAENISRALSRNPIAVRGGRARARTATRDSRGRFVPTH